MNNQPIGLFDSGVGGTSIWKEVVLALPYENTIYLADSKYAPYGKRSKNEIIDLSIKNTEKLLSLGCKIIVVACNTATTNAIEILRSRYKIPFIGIEPAIKPAALLTKTKKVGVLATKGTLASELFAKTSGTYANEIDVIEVVGDGLVELIEEGKTETTEMRNLLSSYLEPMIDKDIDHLVLGCSHYPYLIPILQKTIPSHIKIIDSGEAVAKQTKAILTEYQLLNSKKNRGTHNLFTNSSLTTLNAILENTDIHFSSNYLDF